jgi:uncharacterized protein DUF4202
MRVLASRRARRRLRPHFPHLAVAEGEGEVRVTRGWIKSDLYALDAAVEGARSLEIADDDIAVAVMTRYQRLVPRPHALHEVLYRHRTLHDLSLPLVAADYRHALDTWQWLLRLHPEADAALQIAALFHDVERLRSEPHARIEQHAPDYQRFKDAHARIGARMTRLILAGVVGEPMLARIEALIAGHEHHGDLSDADGLSFFSLNSFGFYDYYGAAHTRKKVAWTLARLSPRARALLDTVGLSPAVAGLVREAS